VTFCLAFSLVFALARLLSNVCALSLSLFNSLSLSHSLALALAFSFSCSCSCSQFLAIPLGLAHPPALCCVLCCTCARAHSLSLSRSLSRSLVFFFLSFITTLPCSSLFLALSRVFIFFPLSFSLSLSLSPLSLSILLPFHSCLPLFSFSPSWISRSFCLSLSPWARYLLLCLFLSRTLRSLFSRSLILLFPFTHFLLRARAHSLTLSIRFLHPFSILSIFFSRPLACALSLHLSLLP
jgi:hypothetical protein